MKKEIKLMRGNVDSVDYVNEDFDSFSFLLTKQDSEEIYDAIYDGCKVVITIEKPILDTIERQYLQNIIKPFKKRVKSIYKIKSTLGTYFGEEHYHIVIELTDFESIKLPAFNKKTNMYKGMKLDKHYTLKELKLK